MAELQGFCVQVVSSSLSVPTLPRNAAQWHDVVAMPLSHELMADAYSFASEELSLLNVHASCEELTLFMVEQPPPPPPSSLPLLSSLLLEQSQRPSSMQPLPPPYSTHVWQSELQEVHFEAQAEPPPPVMQEQQELEHEDAEPSETSSRSAAKSFTVAMRMSNGAR